jgi:hypothetical protein
MSFSHRSGTPPAAPDPWTATRAQTELATQIMQDSPVLALRDIGQLVAENHRELFVSCEPGLALQQQFEHLQPEFIAVHDMHTTLSAKLLAGIAVASGRAVQRLTIRRQGYGNSLATLAFVELPTASGAALRLYATAAEADTASRHAITRSLLGFARLGVILVGDVPAHAQAALFKPLQEDILRGPWPNRELLLLPLAGASALASLGIELARSTGLGVRTTPTVTRPADAWTFISGAWGRQQEAGGVPASAPSSAASRQPQTRPPMPSTTSAPFPFTTDVLSPRPSIGAPTQPLPLRPMPEVPRSLSRAAGDDPLARYVQQLMALNGMVSCCVLDTVTGEALAHAGARPSADDLADHGAELIAAMLATSRALGFGTALPDATITLGSHHLVLRGVPRHPRLALHAVLDKTQANVTLARLQIARLDSSLDEA